MTTNNTHKRSKNYVANEPNSKNYYLYIYVCDGKGINLHVRTEETTRKSTQKKTRHILNINSHVSENEFLFSYLFIYFFSFNYFFEYRSKESNHCYNATNNCTIIFISFLDYIFFIKNMPQYSCISLYYCRMIEIRVGNSLLLNYYYLLLSVLFVVLVFYIVL